MEKVRPENSCDQQTTVKKPLQFNVIARGCPGAITYELQATNDESKPYLKDDNRIKLPFGPDWYDISFHLIDNSSSRMIFDQGQPICAQVGAGCPKRDSGFHTDDQLKVETVLTKMLVLENRNQKQVEIGYTLFFRDHTGELVQPPFDPIMDNGGGGGNVA